MTPPSRERGEEERLPRAGGSAVPELERPEPVDRDLPSAVVAERADALERAVGLRLVGVDLAVAEVPDEQVAAELPERRRRKSDAPGRVQAIALEALERLPAGAGADLLFPSLRGAYFDLHNFLCRSTSIA
jgi:hypothetical protein